MNKNSHKTADRPNPSKAMPSTASIVWSLKYLGVLTGTTILQKRNNWFAMTTIHTLNDKSRNVLAQLVLFGKLIK